MMDIDIHEISTDSVSRINLGLGTPFMPNDVFNLRKFVYDKTLGEIVQEKENKFLVTRGNPISVITQIPVTERVNKDLVAIASPRSTFWNATEDNIQNMCRKYLEWEARIRYLEEKLRHVNMDKGIH